MPRRIKEADLIFLIDTINDGLEERGFDWHLVYYPGNGFYDVRKQFNGSTTVSSISADAVTTKKDLYLWLRGFQTGMWLEADHG
jgi:hypothetical protein